ncbi:MAG: hypothetical protein OEZ15_01050 [Gammaproteobacteria bacterium]|nr:hypothetical protein [Gammaproteobacteria bacterium]
MSTSTTIYGDSRFDRLSYKLVDFSDIESIHMTNEEIAKIACQHKAAASSNPHIKTAIVTRTDKDGLSDLVNNFAAFFSDSSWEVQIFQDRDEANAWLGRTTSS